MAMLDKTDKIALLKLARMALQSYLNDETIPVYNAANPSLLEKKGAFVSLHNHDELRGCIGLLFPDYELYKVVQHCAVSAALEDSRFDPVTQEELPALNIEISVLSPFHPIKDIEEIEVGKHGLYLVHGHSKGLLLPQVATSYAWNRLTFLEQTCRKAGLADTAWRNIHTIIHTFEAEVFDEQMALEIQQ
jgi:AmmeMemoRadiSam system protein A